MISVPRVPQFQHPPISADDDVVAELAAVSRSAMEYHSTRVIVRALIYLIRKVDHMSKETDDLAASVANISDAVTAAVADIQALAQQIADGQANSDGPAIEDAVGKLNGLADTLKAAVAPPAAPAG